ncbi:MAG TPA: hypothetical protein VLY03_12455 [Bacteroidota bacterium]|nr:hypothetical protein [Bacteroidota bacterium]
MTNHFSSSFQHALLGLIALCLAVVFASYAAASLKIVSSSVGNVGGHKQLTILATSNAPVMSPLDSSKFWLGDAQGEKVICSEVFVNPTGTILLFNFYITPGNVAIIEKLVSDSSGYFLSNDVPILFNNGSSIGTDTLRSITTGGISKIDEEAWNKFVLDAYAGYYLYPPTFNIGTTLGVQDSMNTGYYIELTHSQAYIHAGDWQGIWGLKGRWSTDHADKLNFAQFYPLVLLHNDPILKLNAALGVETGYLGFSSEARGTLVAQAEYRLPFNLIDFTFGIPRGRLNPIINASIQWNYGWARTDLPDSLKRSVDAIVGLRYDIPIAKDYYLQSSASGDYTTINHQVTYQYDLSLGYLINGEIHVAAEYKQGNQLVTYQFDRQLLLGFGLELMNQSVAH